ncbi:MAG: hypothetical protein EOP85_07780 [Verrucomicrobiaceae bacterium]|nr:MAG: hypothetical protein EOP85_07780 [Verrucomicrobiaceae bacterium]
MHLRLLATFTACASLAMAQFPAPAGPGDGAPPEETKEVAKPSVKKLDETRFQIGQVIFDKKTREIRFPAKVNMTEGLLEFLVVHEKGKLHESLFSTETSPTDLNLALTLLSYKPSKELYPLPNDTGGTSNSFPEVPPGIKFAARVNIDAEWTTEGKTRRLSVNELIQHEVKVTAMPAGPWVYGGSDFKEGKFIAETSGDIIAIFLSMAALVNYPGEDNADDTVWIPFPKRVPEIGTAVTVIITPYQK